MKSSKHMWKRCISALLVLVMVAAFILPNVSVSAADTNADLWIDPVNGNDTNDGTTEQTALKTIQAAKTKAAELSETKDVVVILKSGTYDASETIVFGEADSGKNGHTITYKAASGATPIISGGTRLEGWTLHDASKNIYVTDIPEGTELTRSFYVDGKVQTMAYIEQSPIDWTVLNSSGYRSPYVESENSHEYLILDLGEDKLVSGLTMYAGGERASDGNAAGFPKDFTIQTSADGVNWSTQVTETDYTAPIARGAAQVVFPTVGARFIKIDVTKLGNTSRSGAGKYHLALSEILVGLSGKENKLNLNLVQHLNMATPVGAGSTTLVAGTASEITLGAEPLTNPISVSGIRFTANSGLAGVRGNLTIEAFDGNAWITVYEKKNQLFAAENDIAFNAAKATKIRLTTNFNLDGAMVLVYAPSNLAEGTTVTAPGQNANKLTDGIFAGNYTSPSYMTAVAGESDIVINLGSVQDVGAVRLYPTYENGKPVGYMKAVRVLTSKDGVEYTTALELADMQVPEFGSQLLLFTYGVKAQYIKIQPLLLTSAGNDYRLQLEEVEVVPTKVEVDESNQGPTTGYRPVYTPASLASATPYLGYYADASNMTGTPVDHQAAAGEADCIIDKKSNSYGWSGLINLGEMKAHGGTKVAAFYLDMGTPTAMNVIEITMDKDIWGAPRSYEVQINDGTQWITVAEATNAEWTTQNYTVLVEFEKTNVTAARLLAYDLYLSSDGSYPDAITQTPGLYTTNFILNEFNPQLKEMVAYEVDTNQDAPTVEKNKIPLTSDNVIGLGYYNDADRDEVKPYYTGYNSDPNGNYMRAAANAMFDNNATTYGGAAHQQYQWIPPIGPNTPVIVLDASKSNGGQPVNINAIELTVRNDGRNAPYDYILQVTTSATEDNWITLVEETAKDWTISSKELYKFNSLEIYKVRLVATYTTPDANISIDSVMGTVNTALQLAEFALYSINDPTNPVAENVCTQGQKASGDQTYSVHLIDALNDNTENKFNANKAIDGYIDPVEQIGFVVPEKYGFDELWHPENVEMHTLYLWYHNIQHFTGISGDGTEIYLETSLMPTWIANDYVFIDSVGEWYIDRETNKIYYKADGTMDGKEAILPLAERIIQMDYASNIKFEGITFSYTTWTHPSEYEYNDQQANTYYEDGKWKQVPASLLLTGVENIVFDDCDFTNLGAAGIKIASDGNKLSDGNQIINSRFHDIGYSGIIIGEVFGHHGYKSWMLVKNTTIKNNYVTRVGLEMRDSPGIVACYTNGTVIEHNEVAFCPYTGISTGWGWDTEEFGTSGSNPNQAFLDDVGNVKVIYNYVHDTGKNNRDGGSIYNLGSSKGSEVAYNYIYNSWDGDDVYENGLYLDQGSAHFEVHHNVIGENVGYWMHQWMYTIHDNVWHDNYYVDTKSRDNGTNNTAYDNYKFNTQAELEADPGALAIMNEAGLLDESVKDGVWEGFAKRQDIVQEFWPGKNSRYIEPDWGWRDVGINGQVGRTSYDSIKKSVNINVKEEADITNLVLMFTLDDGWTCDKASGVPQDFTNPIVYTLTNGKQTVKWTVNVKQQKDSGGEIPGEEVDFADIIANHQSGEWTVEPSRVIGGVMHHTSYSGYIKEYFGGSTIFLFDMQIDVQTNEEFAAISLNNQDPTLDWNSGSTEYMINFQLDNIEVQKFNGGARTVFFGEQANYNAIYGILPNHFFTPDEVHSIKCGAIDTDDGGVRLFLYIDGNLVFDFIDNEDAITGGGHFAVYAESQTISLRGYSNNDATPDRSELDWALYVVDSLDVRDYKQETWGQLQTAVVTVNDILASFGGVSQEMVDRCTMILWEALDALEQVDGTQGAIIPERPLEPGELDWSDFDEAYNMLFTLDFSLYTEESINELYAAIGVVSEMVNKEDITQDEIDQATKLLLDAINGLVRIDGGIVLPPVDRPDGLDYVRMDAALTVAFSAQESNYTAESYAALQAAIANAYTVMSDPNCTQEEVNAAYIALVNAINGLVPTGNISMPTIPPIQVPSLDDPDEPGTDEPGTDEPGTDEPGTDEPGTDEPGTDEPGTDEPGTDEPGTDEPGTDEPGEGTPPGKTGDDFKFVPAIIVLVVAMVGAAVAVVLLKKNGKR